MIFTASRLVKSCLIAAVLLVFCFAANAQENVSPERFYEYMERGETEKVYVLMIELFRENGASVNNYGGNEGLDLQLREFDDQVNDFSYGRVSIGLGRMMTPEEARVYWDKWSQTLTENKWRQNAFFKSEEERHLVANFNVLVLMAHEFGHYFDYRYEALPKSGGFGGLELDAPINCGEFFADHFAVGVINYLATDKRFAALRSRYVELLADMDAQIPARNQIKIASFEQLNNDCGAVKLESNGIKFRGIELEAFQKYVSAYFNRYRVMLEKQDFPSLAALVENKLRKPFYSRFTFLDKAVSVRAIRSVPPSFAPGCESFEMVEYEANQPDLGENNSPIKLVTQKLSELNDKGEIRHFEADSDVREKGWQQFRVRIYDEQKKLLDAPNIRLPLDGHKVYGLAKAALFSDDDFWLIFYPALSYFPKNQAENKNLFVWIVQFTRRAGKLNATMKKFAAFPNRASFSCNLNWFVAPAGKLFLMTADERTGYRVYEVNRKTLALKLKKTLGKVTENSDRKFDFSYFANDDGDIFFIEEHTYYGNRAIGKFAKGLPYLVKNVAGSINGEDKRKIEFTKILAARFLRPDTIRVVDKFSDSRAYIRDIMLR